MTTKKNLVIILTSLICLVISLSFAQQPSTDSTTLAPTTTSIPPNDTISSSSFSTEATTQATDGNKTIEEPNQKQEFKQPKVLIIHHHYRDGPSDYDLTRRLQPVGIIGQKDNNQKNGNNYDEMPSEFRDPNYPYNSHLKSPEASDSHLQPNAAEKPQEQPEEDLTRFDPLSQYTDSQKKRQFFQDLLMNQLGKFELEIEPMIEREENMTEKNDMEELLGAVLDLKQTIENHQIFNISELMDDWKEGRLKPSTQSSVQPQISSSKEPQLQLMPKVYHRYHQRPRPWTSPLIPQNPSRSEMTLNIPPPVTRTYLLVPQSRIIQPEFVPHFHPGTNGIPPTFSTPQIQYRRFFQPSASFQSPMVMYHRRSPTLEPSLNQQYNQVTRYSVPSAVEYTLGRSASGNEEGSSASSGEANQESTTLSFEPTPTSTEQDSTSTNSNIKHSIQKDNVYKDSSNESESKESSAIPSSSNRALFGYGPEIEYQK